MSPDEELMVIFGALHVIALVLGVVLFMMFLRSDTTSSWKPPEDDDGGGGGGNDRLPSTPKPRPTGGIPLPDAEPAVLAAMAAGCVVVLPHRYAATFGDAAVYCAPNEVTDTVRTLYGRRAALRRQSNRGLDFVRDHHGHDQYATGVEALA